MSETGTPSPADAAQASVLRIYQATSVVMLLLIAGLSLYCYRLGPLVGPGVEESFGLAVAMMFLFSALLVHVLDRTYREWPLGRRVHPGPPTTLTDERVAFALRVVVVVAAALLIAYVLAGVLS